MTRRRVSVIIVAKNVKPILAQCLERLKIQDYDRDILETLIIDGGSTDGTQDLARSFGARVVNGGYPDNQEARRWVGARQATGEILLYLDADNLIPGSGWLREMLEPFERPTVVASFTKWYDPDPLLPSIDRYYALLGGNDPVVYYLGKHDRVPYGDRSLPVGAELVLRNSNYEIVRFMPECLPTIGCNGFLVRKSYFDHLELTDDEQFFHTDVHVDLLAKDSRVEYAIVTNTIIHATGGSLINNLHKRLRYQSEHTGRLGAQRRYLIFDSRLRGDHIRLLYAILAGGTVILPLFRAIAGFVRTQRWEWFWHPIATFGMVAAYGAAVLRIKFG